MSHNQSRGDRTESGQYRKTGRSSSFNQQRHFAGGFKGGGGSSSATPANPSISNRSFKNPNSNVQGGQSRVRSPNVIQDSSHSSPVRVVQNGAQQHQPPPVAVVVGVSDALVTNKSINDIPMDAPAQRITQAVSRSPSSNVSTAVPSTNASTASSDTNSPATPSQALAPVDASSSHSLQFGSISPGFMNVMQIPARTSSAPPNLDEQKKVQACPDSLKAAPAVSTPSIPKQRMPKKDTRILDQANTREAQRVSKSKRDVQVSAAPPVTETQKPSVHPMSGMSMQRQFHQQQVPLQFGVPNPQIQSQAMPTSSLPIPIQMGMSIPLPMGNPPMFVAGLQPPHAMQSQGLMHQAHNLNYSSQMSPQMPHQLGSIGINMAPQHPPQQAAKFTAFRKTVKITHPETHEELRLDGSAGPRSHPNMPPQSQPIPSFPPNHPMNYYANSYNSSSHFFPPPSSVPLNSAQILPSSQPPRFFNQVTVKPAASSHVDKGILPSSAKGESTKPLRPHGEDSRRPQKDFEPSYSSYLQQSKPSDELSSRSASMASKQSATVSGSVTVETELPKTLSSSSLALVDDIASSLSSGAGEARNRTVDGPDSIKDEQKKPSNRRQWDQVSTQFLSASGLSSQLPEPETLEAPTIISSQTSVMLETAKESSLTTSATALEAYDSKSDRDSEGKASQSSNILDTDNVKNRQSKTETPGKKDKGEVKLPESSKPHMSSTETSSISISPESSEITCNHEESSTQEVVASSSYGSLLGTEQQKLEEHTCCSGDVSVVDDLIASTSILDGGIGVSAGDGKTSTSDASFSVPDSVNSKEASVINSAIVEQEYHPVSVSSPSESVSKSENEGIENSSVGLASPPPPGVKEKAMLEPNVAKSTTPTVKKKKKELYRKAEAAGTSSDLYMAYKGPEEKKETNAPAQSTENTLSNTTDVTQDIAISSLKSGKSKVEPEDWEDAVDISTPKLTMKNEHQVNDRDGDGLMTKKYSRDFLFKFAGQCTDLPDCFEIPSDMADALMDSSINISRESNVSPGRNFDRPIGGSRPDHRGSVMGDEDKWSKLPGPLMSGKGDMRMDIAYGGNVKGFRPSQVGNYGVLRNPRVQTPVQHAGGILAGPIQSLGPQGGLQRNNSDSDRWQRGTAFQKGLMPYPQTPLQVMHKAGKKYEIGKVSDEEEIKQRQLKAILNKLTPQNFEKLFEQVKQVNIDNVVTLSGVISQIFDKALMEPTFCEMYANFCFHLAAVLPDLSVETERITFKRLLLNKCQEEFERGEKEEEEANKADEEGEAKQTEEEREEKRLRARRRMLGNIRLIGELYKKRMLTERIMHECIKKLLGTSQNPDEEDVEALCKLMGTIGVMIDHSKAKEHMDAYFDIMAQFSNNMKLSPRVRFMLKDSIDLRKNKWQQRRKVEGPKKIDEVHRDAAQERQAQASRLARAPSIGTSGRRGPPLDFAHRASNMLSSPSPQMGGFRAVPLQLRGNGSHDFRLEERHHFENRNMSVSVPQRPLSNDSITLGPQGGLARGMAFRGQPSAPGLPLVDMPSPGEARRIAPGLNGFSSMPERTAYVQREDLTPRYMPERFSSPSSSVYDQSNPQERSINHGNIDIRNADRNFDRSLPTSPSTQGQPPTSMQDASSEKMWPEERLQDMSMATIKEFYSAKDENEVALCIKELNAPSFYPSMISIWVTYSFERNDTERDLLTKLLIGLMKAPDGIISQDQLIKGFEAVLTTLEDTVNDAPRAAEFLGRIFATFILENVVSFSEVGRLIYEGGEEQGRLVEIGLAAEVLGSILEIIKSEKGDSVLTQICSSSNLRLENFKPPGSNKSSRLDKFT